MTNASTQVILNQSKGSLKKTSLGVSIDLSSRVASNRVLSAQTSLTSVFGMGTGGPSLLKTLTAFALWILTSRLKLTSSKLTHFCVSRFQSSGFLPFTSFPLFYSFAFLLLNSLIYIPCTERFMHRYDYLRSVSRIRWCTFRDSNPGPTD